MRSLESTRSIRICDSIHNGPAAYIMAGAARAVGTRNSLYGFGASCMPKCHQETRKPVLQMHLQLPKTWLQT